MGSRPPLTKGMFVEITLAAKPVDGIIIPRSALRGGQVMVADADNRLKRVSVSAYLVQGDLALITGGLEEGAQIVVSTPVPMIKGMLLDLHSDADLMAELAAAGSAQ